MVFPFEGDYSQRTRRLTSDVSHGWLEISYRRPEPALKPRHKSRTADVASGNRRTQECTPAQSRGVSEEERSDYSRSPAANREYEHARPPLDCVARADETGGKCAGSAAITAAVRFRTSCRRYRRIHRLPECSDLLPPGRSPGACSCRHRPARRFPAARCSALSCRCSGSC